MTVDLEKSILEELPQIPYVLDQIDGALKWAKEVLSEGGYNNMLDIVYDTVKYVHTISEPNFFKVHYIIAVILTNIINADKDERFQKFDSASKAVEKAYRALVINPEDIEKDGCFKTVLMHLVPLAKGNIELFTIGLIGIKHDLLHILAGMKSAGVKTPITSQDYISVLGYALVMANIRMANLRLPNETYKIYNEISIILNNDLNY